MTGLPPELRDGAMATKRARRLLVALDFDGTLAPFVDDPADARALPASARAIEELILAPDTVVAMVSGRSLASLRQVASPDPRVLLVGSHGAERYAPAEYGAADLAADLSLEAAETLGAAHLELVDLAQTHSGAWVEEKPAGLVLHTRMVEPAAIPGLIHEATTRMQALGDGVHITLGKNVVEISVLPADKGQGLDWLRATTQADVVVFAGDDRTDENAFVRLDPASGDLGVKVGGGDTSAQYRVDGPGDVAVLLGTLADVRH
ncbi:trehalose-phosphatase [Galactobacter sp.]|uniref:trehalose-phosphatase n=1 Tax=Galactobacter sp. TaxID=2676125 RepID=UPI0025C51BED|nr:trehalose-phosphatase [Galactobacter sp.]